MADQTDSGPEACGDGTLKSPTDPYLRAPGLACLFAFGLVLSEWLFYATKPSFVSRLSAGESAQLLLSTSGLAMAVAVPLCVLLSAAGLLAARTLPARFREWGRPLATAVPASLALAIAALMADNFTYTFFGINAGSARHGLQLLYAVGYLLVFILAQRRIGALLETDRKAHRAGLLLLAVCLAALSRPGLSPSGTHAPAGSAEISAANKPNIVIISSDGISAKNMGVYGYSRPNTPFLSANSSKAMVFENAFSNSGPTTGSIVSTLTGKSPLQTRVIYRPDTLRGNDQTEHFPSLLRALGYRSASFGVKWYVDPDDLGMRNAFDVTLRTYSVKHRFLIERIIDRAVNLLPAAFSGEKLFVQSTSERVLERLFHVLFLRPMTNAYEEVAGTAAAVDTDFRRMQYLARFIANTGTPWFSHVHLMTSHGPRFNPPVRKFSAGTPENPDWHPDIYDDAVLFFDQKVAEVFGLLAAQKLLDSTIVVVTSDHGLKWTTHERIPLLIFFPNADHRGRVSANVQLLDIAPTLLEAIGGQAPQWMAGRSLLKPGLTAARHIVAVLPGEITKDPDGAHSVLEYEPPYFSLGKLALIDCHHWYAHALEKGRPLKAETLEHAAIEGHTAPCAEGTTASRQDIVSEMDRLLAAHGYR